MTLTDLPPDWRPAQDDLSRLLRSLTSNQTVYPVNSAYDDWQPRRVYRGIYEAHINFDKELEGLIVDQWPDFSDWSWESPNSMRGFYGYGVVDHWTQLPVRMLDDDPRHLLVYLSRHARDDQPPHGGWRWRKWGPYYGVHSPETSTDFEYLHDATDVVEVWSYCVVEVRRGDS